MEKIALVGARLERDKKLLQLLKALFPECQIRVIPSEAEVDDDNPLTQEVVKRAIEIIQGRSS